MGVKLEHKHELLIPLTMPDGEVIETLVIPRPRGKQLRRFKEGALGFGEILDMIAELCALPKSVVDEMDAADVIDVGEALTDFFQSRRQKSGSGPS